MADRNDLEELRRRNRELEAKLSQREAALVESERRYRRIFEALQGRDPRFDPGR